MATAAHGKQEHGLSYFFEVDGIEYHVDHEPVTGGEIMDMAGIPRETGLLQLLEDGTQAPVTTEEEFDLEPGRRFKKRPRFKRG